LASLAASNVPDAPVPAPWPLPPVTVPEAFDPPDAPVEDEPALLPLVAPAVPEPLALVEDLPPQLTTKASTTSSSAAPLVGDMATPSRIIQHGPWPDEPTRSRVASYVTSAAPRARSFFTPTNHAEEPKNWLFRRICGRAERVSGAFGVSHATASA